MTDLIKRTATIIFGLILAQSSMAALPAMIGDQKLPSLAPLVREASPAVVSIATKGTVETPRNPLMDDPFFQRFFGGPQQQQRQRQVRSAGSGVIVDAQQGYILTNHHVVENADEIEILLADKRVLEATVVGSDPGSSRSYRLSRSRCRASSSARRRTLSSPPCRIQRRIRSSS